MEVKGTTYDVMDEHGQYFYISEQEMKRAAIERDRFVLIRVFGTPMPAHFARHRRQVDLKFLLIRDPIGQLEAGFIERRDDPTRPGTIRLFIGGGDKACQPCADGRRDYVRKPDDRVRCPPSVDDFDNDHPRKFRCTRP